MLTNSSFQATKIIVILKLRHRISPRMVRTLFTKNGQIINRKSKNTRDLGVMSDSGKSRDHILKIC